MRMELQEAKSRPWQKSFANMKLISDDLVQNKGFVATHPLDL